MIRILALLAIISLWTPPAQAQQSAWVQVEAQPTLAQVQERLQAYASVFPDVSGYELRSGWYAITMGPYDAPLAAQRLNDLRLTGQVPGDSFIADGRNFVRQIWPDGESRPTPTAIAPIPQAGPAEMSLPEARRNEASLTAEDRRKVQEALQWEGFYNAAIDGAFGPGTRNAMATWQIAMGFEPTGVLTPRQLIELEKNYLAALAKLDMQPVDRVEAGLRIQIPAGLVDFARFAPPFVQYDSKGDSGVRVLLISQPGNRDTLAALYDVLQTLEIVPLRGPRELNASSFLLTGSNDRLQSYAYATLAGGTVKGFMLIWRPEDEKLMTRAAQMMRDSFDPYGDKALDETLGAAVAQHPDQLSGLDIRRPTRVQTGFFVDARGLILTAANGLDQCGRITIEDELAVDLAASDAASGLALLKPQQPLAPIAIASFQTGTPRLQSEIAVAGYAYGTALNEPVLTFGTLADLTGLDGQADVARLTLTTLPGDVGGAVVDMTGAALGALLPRQDGQRQLPLDVNFAADVPAIAEFLLGHDVKMIAAETAAHLAPEDLAIQAANMTVRIACWN